MKKKNGLQINVFTFQHKTGKQGQTELNGSKMKEIINVGVKINDIENRKKKKMKPKLVL